MLDLPLACRWRLAGRVAPAPARRAGAARRPRSRLSGRSVPARWPPRCTGPIRVRTSRDTGCPTSASIRRTMCLRPSCSTTSTIAWSPCVWTMRERVDRRRPVLELDAGPQPAADVPRHRPGHGREVGLQHPERGVHQPVREVAVVGEQQQPLAVGVEPADVEQPLLDVETRLVHQVGDGAPAPVVAHRAEHAARLVQREVHQVVADDHPVAVDVDDRGRRVDPGTERGHRRRRRSPGRPRSAPRTRAATRARRRPAPSAAGCRRPPRPRSPRALSASGRQRRRRRRRRRAGRSRRRR